MKVKSMTSHPHTSPASLLLATCMALALSPLQGCEDKKPTTTPPPATQPAAKSDVHDHDHADDKDHDHDKGDSKTSGHDHGHGGAVIDLGVQTIGPFSVKVTRDDGAIVPGKDSPIDVTVTTPEGQTGKVASVRFWIGTQDAKGSVKAKGDIEDPKEPNRYHTHAEIPNPIPADSKLWVEIEDDKGVKVTGSFDLRR